MMKNARLQPDAFRISKRLLLVDGIPTPLKNHGVFLSWGYVIPN